MHRKNGMLRNIGKLNKEELQSKEISQKRSPLSGIAERLNLPMGG
jgi:hypothetical protein